jgi:prophage maintenance system killer protein/prophage antirepressor-like protein
MDKKTGVRLETHLENESVWLTQDQIGKIFDTDRSSITKHINSIFKTKELDEKSNVQKMHIANSDKPVKFFNLDVILSVGYRVNSKIATKFRIWATNVLRKHIVDGYTINENRLLEANNKFKELQQAISFIQETSKKKALTGQEAEILNLLSTYSKTLTLLNEYDKTEVREIKGTKSNFKLTYEDCKSVIISIKKELAKKDEATELFGNEKDNSFESIIKNLYQTFSERELYKTLEDKASNLLYLVIKDHSFSDGNKRIGSFLFIYFLDKTNSLYKINGEKKINDNALVALALLIAESNPEEKEVLIKIIKNLIA